MRHALVYIIEERNTLTQRTRDIWKTYDGEKAESLLARFQASRTPIEIEYRLSTVPVAIDEEGRLIGD